jgi:hypothetical protein
MPLKVTLNHMGNNPRKFRKVQIFRLNSVKYSSKCLLFANNYSNFKEISNNYRTPPSQTVLHGAPISRDHGLWIHSAGLGRNQASSCSATAGLDSRSRWPVL